MDKSSRLDIALREQIAAWEQWNSSTGRGSEKMAPVNRRQAEIVVRRVASLGHDDLSIVDVGCGNGWLCELLVPFGSVTGTDLVDAALAGARARLPGVRFISGDFFEVDLTPGSFDVVTTLEVLSHVADQPAFMQRLASLLRPGGHLVMATQNRPVLERYSAIPGPAPGQIRHWVDAKQLRRLLAPHFEAIEIESICPVGDQGYLRIANSVKLNRLAEAFMSPRTIERLKERAMMGHTLMAWARKC